MFLNKTPSECSERSSFIEDVDVDYESEPQVNYCCGHKEISVSPAFKQSKTKISFVAVVFAFKLIQYTFVVLFLFEVMHETDNFFAEKTYQFLKGVNWLGYIAGLYLFCSMGIIRCVGCGKRRSLGLLFFICHTIAITITCTTLATVDFVYPHRYIIVMVLSTLAVLSLGMCIFTTVFEVDVTRNGIYSALFAYFLLVIGFLHVIYFAKLQELYDIPYFSFLQTVALGGGLGLFLTMAMISYVQQMMIGNCMPITEKHYIYVTLLM